MDDAMATPPDQRRAPSRPPQALPPGPSRKPAEPVLQQRALAALLLALTSLVGLLMVSGGNTRRGAVVLVVVLVIGGAALWLSMTAMSRARRAGTARPPLALTATVLGVAGTALSALALLAFIIFWPQIIQYSDCMAGANTVIAQNACNAQLSDTLRNDVGLVGG
jgi:hypothetical protein